MPFLPQQQWTAALVREKLPTVRVKYGNKIFDGRVTGRLNQFATVTIYAELGPHLRGTPWMDFHVAWETLADCLDENTCVLV